MAASGSGQHLHWGNEDVEGLDEEGEGRVKFDFHDKGGWLWGYKGEARGEGEVKEAMSVQLLAVIVGHFKGIPVTLLGNIISVFSFQAPK